MMSNLQRVFAMKFSFVSSFDVEKAQTSSSRPANWSGRVQPALLLQAGLARAVVRIVGALRPGGRFAGDLFGDRHAFGQYDDVMLMREDEVRECLRQLEVEAFDIEDGVRPSGNEVTRWHAFGVTARKPAASDAA